MSNANLATIVVENSAELADALEALAAGNGGTILMKNAGTTYQASLYDAGENEPPITITSFDQDDPAVIERLTMTGRENITVDNVVFDSTESDLVRAPYMRDLEVSSSTGVTVKNSVFKSDAEGTLTDINGEDAGAFMGMIRGSEDFTFSGNHVSGYASGLGVFETIGIAIKDNEFSHIQGDGMQFGGVQDVLIEGNYMHDFLGSLQSVNHDDMIQFWGTNAVLRTENVIIRGNVLDASNGSGAQAIFGRNENYVTQDDLFQNILIEDNIIHNGSYHGITMYDTNHLTIQNNTILWNKDAKIQINSDTADSFIPGIRTTNSQNVDIHGNITPSISAPTDVDVSDNAIVTYDDKTAGTHVEAHFVNALVGGGGDLRDLMLLPDSDWVGLFGSEHSQPLATADSLTSVMTIRAVMGDFNSFVFDASLSQDETGYLDDTEAEFIWHFSDGSTMTGISVVKTFEDKGENGVSLTVVTDAATQDSITRGVVVQDESLVVLNFNTAIEDSSSYNSVVSSTSLSTGPEVAGVSGAGFVLDGSSSVQIARQNEHILGLDFFSLGLAVKLDPASQGNVFLSFHQSMLGTIEDDGSVTFSITTEQGTFVVSSEAGLVSDTDWHKIDVTYNSTANALMLYVDGALAGEMQASGPMNAQSYWDLSIGSIWGNSIEGVVDDFSLTADTKTASEIDLGYRAMQLNLNHITSFGEDVILQGNGDDNFYFVEGAEDAPRFFTRINSYGGSDEIVVDGGKALIRSSTGKDTIVMSDADDIAYGGKNMDTLYGGAGADSLVGNKGDDEIYGGQGHDTINGGDDRDVLYGGRGADVLIGGQGRDEIFGGQEQDTLNGGNRNDILTGGTGADTFVFNGQKNERHDTITDFNTNVDHIQITGGMDFSDVSIVSSGEDTIITLTSGTRITLEDVNSTKVDIDNFEFA